MGLFKKKYFITVVSILNILKVQDILKLEQLEEEKFGETTGARRVANSIHHAEMTFTP